MQNSSLSNNIMINNRENFIEIIIYKDQSSPLNILQINIFLDIILPFCTFSNLAASPRGNSVQLGGRAGSYLGDSNSFSTITASASHQVSPSDSLTLSNGLLTFLTSPTVTTPLTSSLT